VDAPCSGEATFRSDPKAVKNWSLNFQDRCARIQDEILWYGSKLVRPGGILVYSTCTFNTFENEGTVARFLEKSPNFQLDSISPNKGYQTGINPSEQYPFDFNNTVRIWPHKAPGEGHFIARLKNTEMNKSLDQAVSDITPSRNDGIMASYQRFFDQTIRSNDNTLDLLPQNSHLIPYGNQLYSIPPNTPDLSGLRVKHWGWWIGTLQGDEFIPSPALASGLNSDDSQKVLEFSVSDPELQQYHRGSPIKDFLETRNRSEWVLITVDGITLGWGKANKGKIKSYLPSWLRTQ
jgi:NOL1/NOP2/fmu family ribosome biogenesis protein